MEIDRLLAAAVCALGLCAEIGDNSQYRDVIGVGKIIFVVNFVIQHFDNDDGGGGDDESGAPYEY